jgi:tetratricopeptide (TPR) repeat protein
VADKETPAPKDDAPAAPKRLEVKPVQIGGESLVDRLLPHMKKIIVGLLIVIAIVGVVMLVTWFKDRKHGNETEKLAAVLDVGKQPIRPAGAAAEPVDPKKPPPPGFADGKERANAILDALTKQGTDAAGPTYRAAVLVQAGKLDDAIAEYRKAQSLTGLDGVLAREGLGIALEMKASQDKDATARQKGLEDALATFTSMQPDAAGPRRAYALYHQGRILELLGKRDDARARFEQVKELGNVSKTDRELNEIAPGGHPEALDEELARLVDERLASLGAS